MCVRAAVAQEFRGRHFGVNNAAPSGHPLDPAWPRDVGATCGVTVGEGAFLNEGQGLETLCADAAQMAVPRCPEGKSGVHGGSKTRKGFRSGNAPVGNARWVCNPPTGSLWAGTSREVGAFHDVGSHGCAMNVTRLANSRKSLSEREQS